MIAMENEYQQCFFFGKEEPFQDWINAIGQKLVVLLTLKKGEKSLFEAPVELSALLFVCQLKPFPQEQKWKKLWKYTL